MHHRAASDPCDNPATRLAPVRSGDPWRRRIRALGLAGLVVAALVVWLGRGTGPAYEGRPLRHWLTLAGSPDHRDRLRAGAVLRTVGPEAVPELARALEARESRLEAVWLSLRRRWSAHEPETGRRARASAAAAHELARLGPQAAAAAPVVLRWGVRGDDPDGAIRVLEALGAAAVPSLRGGLESPEPSIRALAAQALGSPAFRPAADAVLPLLLTRLDDAHRPVRMGAIRALAVLGAGRPEIGRALAGRLRVDDEATTLVVLGCLTSFDPAGWNAAGSISPLLGAPSARIRLAAARAWVAVGGGVAEVLPVLVALLDEGDLAWMAAETLGRLGPAAAPAIPPLLRQLESEPTHRPSRTPHHAALALGRLGPEAVPGLVRLLEHAASSVRVNAAAAVAGQGTAAAAVVPGLVRMLAAADPEEQMAAANALGALGPAAAAAVPELTRLANLETTQDVIVGHVRSAARDALERTRASPGRD